MRKWLSSVLCAALPFALLIDSVTASTCVISPLGHGKDDTDQVCSSSVTYWHIYDAQVLGDESDREVRKEWEDGIGTRKL